MQIQDTTKLTGLQRQCYGNNKINKVSIKALKKLLPQLKKFVGKKVVLSDGVTLAKKFKNSIQLIEIPFSKLDGSSYRTFLKSGFQRLVLFNDVTIKDRDYPDGGYGVCYYKREITVADIDENGLLIDVPMLDKLIKDYNLNKTYKAITVEKTQKKINSYKDKIRELESTLPRL